MLIGDLNKGRTNSISIISFVQSVSIFVLLFLVPVVMASSSSEPASTIASIISVRGEGTISAEPDTAILTMGITSEGTTAREALSKNNQDMERIHAKLQSVLQDSKNNIQTSNFRLMPTYKPHDHRNPSPPQIIGYSASNDITIRIYDLNKTGSILDTAVDLGINNIMNGIQFTNTPQQTQDFLAQARREAVRNAKSKAETIADELGVTLGKIQSISEGSNGDDRPSPPYMMETMARSAGGGSVPVASGENSYSVTVDIRWEINQESSCTSAKEWTIKWLHE